MNLISLLSTIVTFIFVVAVFRRYLQRGGPHLLFWTIGLVLYGLGTLSEVILALTYNPAVLKLWYLCGAMLTAAWLGEGTIHLLIRRRTVTMALDILLGLMTLAAVVLVALAPVTGAPYDTGVAASAQYRDILTRGTGIIVLTILLNTYGTLALVGGALYSGFLFWRKKVLLNRVIGNILIAAGAMAPAMGGTFVKAGMVDFLYLSEFIGVVLMYIGFIQATTRAPAAQPVAGKPSPSH